MENEVIIDKIGWENGINGDNPSGTTPLSAENLKQMELNAEAGINIVQGRLNETNDSLEALQTFSTSEKIIGTWINGKTLYRKTFQVTMTSKNQQVNISDLNVERGFFDINMSSVHELTNGRYYPPVVANVSAGSLQTAVADSQAVVYFNSDFSKFNVECGYSFSWGTSIITIIYTKTTD